MSKHTPGPWSAELMKIGTIKRGTSAYVLLDGDEYNIAMISSWKSQPDTAAEAEANARLIAAAPELLEALEALLNADLYADGEGIHFIKNADTADGERAVQMARAAIAKATGGDV